MFYIHQHTCISPQQTFPHAALNTLNEANEGKLHVVETPYEGIAPGLLRRMGKAVKIGIGAGLPLVSLQPDGIIIGTANGGMGDCIKFLDQIVEFKEGMLTPLNFVQSTSNAVAGQLAMMSANKGYNITHVHRALAFENAVIDADMTLKEHPGKSYLLGAVDEISSANYNIERLEGSYKEEAISNAKLYETATAGSIAGEGAAMFLVNTAAQNAVARFTGIHTFQAKDVAVVRAQLNAFLEKQLPAGESIDLLLSGENGDVRLAGYYDAVEVQLPEVTVARFKHMSGEYPTAVAFGFWFACHILSEQSLPQHAVKKSSNRRKTERLLVYNNYKGLQHSFILMERV